VGMSSRTSGNAILAARKELFKSILDPEEAPEPIIRRLQRERKKEIRNKVAHFIGPDPAEIEAKKKTHSIN